MPYLADWFGGNPGTWRERQGEQPAPAGITPPSGGSGPGSGYGPDGPPRPPPGPAGPAAAANGTGFVPLAAYFGPNQDGAKGLASGLMQRFPAGMAEGPTVAGPAGPIPADSPGYRVRDAASQAEASSALDTMQPLDAFLARQAGGQPLFDRLAEWAKPYTPPAPPKPPDYGTPPPDTTTTPPTDIIAANDPKPKKREPRW
jgi:hypothetical protein